MSSVEIYSKPGCVWCIRAKNLLTMKKIPYKEFTVGVNATKDQIQTRVAALGESAVVQTLPQIFYTDKTGKVTYIGGFTELNARQSILGT